MVSQHGQLARHYIPANQNSRDYNHQLTTSFRYNKRQNYVKSTTKKIKRVISSYGISTCLKLPRQPRESLKID